MFVKIEIAEMINNKLLNNFLIKKQFFFTEINPPCYS